jgi:hypothetical protein
VKRTFDTNRRLTGTEQEEQVGLAFQTVRQFNEAYANATAKIPWWGGIPAPQFSDNEPLVKIVSSPHDLQPGMILISHPLQPNQSTVLLITSFKPGGPATAVFLTEPKNGVRYNSHDKKFILSSKPNLFVTKQQVAEGVYFGEPAPNLVLDPADARTVTATLFPFQTLAADLASGVWFLAKCPTNILFKEKSPEFTETTIQEDSEQVNVTDSLTLQQDKKPKKEGVHVEKSPVQYDFTVDKNEDLWKKILRLMGGEYELCVYVVEKPPVQLEQKE